MPQSSELTVQKQPQRGAEAVYVVFQSGNPIGYVTKFKDDRHTRNPWKAYRYVQPFMPGVATATPMGMTYTRGKAGQTIAVRAIETGQPISDDGYQP